MVVDRVTRLLESEGHEVTRERAEKSDPNSLKEASITLLAAPTYGQGVLQEDFVAFCDRARGEALKNRKCAVIGLGDPRYEAQYHLESVPILNKFIEKSGGTVILPPLQISGTPVRHLEGFIPHWTKKLLEMIEAL